MEVDINSITTMVQASVFHRMGTFHLIWRKVGRTTSVHPFQCNSYTIFKYPNCRTLWSIFENNSVPTSTELRHFNANNIHLPQTNIVPAELASAIARIIHTSIMCIYSRAHTVRPIENIMIRIDELLALPKHSTELLESTDKIIVYHWWNFRWLNGCWHSLSSQMKFSLSISLCVSVSDSESGAFLKRTTVFGWRQCNTIQCNAASKESRATWR